MQQIHMPNRSLYVFMKKQKVKSNFSINNRYLEAYIFFKLCNFIDEINLCENAETLFPNVKKSGLKICKSYFPHF